MFQKKRSKSSRESISLTQMPRLSVRMSAWQRVHELARESPDRETGGILVGSHSSSDILIAGASDAGPLAIRNESHFLRDTKYCQAFLAQQYADFGFDYVGEWHSHVVPLDQLSHGDLGTLLGIMNDPDYDFPSFAMLLAVVHNAEVDVRSFVGFKPSLLQQHLIVAEARPQLLSSDLLKEDANHGRS